MMDKQLVVLPGQFQNHLKKLKNLKFQLIWEIPVYTNLRLRLDGTRFCNVE